ncbi:TPA_asm: P3 [Picris trirhavirus 1]|nr:MAG: 21 kDa unknown protein [Picris cytorhabdovirus 1]DBA36571.1 TPA_asm: P3 [Picris trirhavirus 1]
MTVDLRGTTVEVNCSLRLLCKRQITLDEVLEILEGLLIQPFSTHLTNKHIQEMILYGISEARVKPIYTSTRSYEWGEKTVATHALWDFKVSSVLISATVSETHGFPMEKMVPTNSGQAKAKLHFTINIRPASRMRFGGVDMIPEGIIFPTLELPDVIKAYRIKHTKRANAAMLQPEKSDKLNKV